MGEYPEVTVLVRTGSSLASVADSRRQFVECCAEVDAPHENGGDMDKDRSEHITGRSRSQFEASVASQVKICEAAPSSLGEVFSLGLKHSEVVADCLNECKDTKDAAEERALLVERESD